MGRGCFASVHASAPEIQLFEAMDVKRGGDRKTCRPPPCQEKLRVHSHPAAVPAIQLQWHLGAISMAHTVFCVRNKKEMEGLDEPPFDSEFGQKIYKNVSKAAWDEWLGRQKMLLERVPPPALAAAGAAVPRRANGGVLFRLWLRPARRLRPAVALTFNSEQLTAHCTLRFASPKVRRPVHLNNGSRAPRVPDFTFTDARHFHRLVARRPAVVLTIRLDTFTGSKSDSVRLVRHERSVSFQRASGVPIKPPLSPLSARMIP